MRRALLTALGLGLAVSLLPAATAAAQQDTCANAEFRTGASALLPDCRAYELVSPADKGANSLQYTDNAPGFTGFPSPDGQHLSFAGIPPMANPQTGLPGIYVADRTASGWITRSASPADCQAPVSAGQDGWIFQGFSDDLSVTAFRSTQNCDAGDEDALDVFTTHPDGSRTWVSQGPNPKTTNVPRTFAGMSGDGQHVLFATSERLILPLEEDRTGSGLYDRTGGETIPVGLANDGTLINQCGATSAGGLTTPGWVPTDGRAIFFTSGTGGAGSGCSPATDDGGQLYARIDHRRTVALSASVRSTPDPGGRQLPTFLGATEDGGAIFFSSAEMLTDDATPGGGLYAYDLSAVLEAGAPAGTLAFLSPSTDGNAASVQELLGMSDDGSVVYFYATGVLAAGAVTGDDNIYRAENGQVEFVAAWESGADIRQASVSSDGSHFVWRDLVGDGTRQVHLYDGTDVVCVSCDPDGDPQTEDALLYAGTVNISGRDPSLSPGSYVTSDGRAYFTSPDQLLARDDNDNLDVYEYADGDLTLISQGATQSDSRLWGLAAGNRDVFFVTYDSLVAQDYDEGDQDAYTARVGGGFPPPADEPAPCLGDGCQGAALRGVGAPLLGSLALRAPTGRATTDRPTRRPTRLAVGKRKRTVRGARGWIRVRVSGRGRIRAFAPRLRRTGRRAGKAGVYRVRVRLRRRAQRRVRRGRAVSVRARVRFAPARGRARTRRVRVTFRPANARRASRGPAARRGGGRTGR